MAAGKSNDDNCKPLDSAGIPPKKCVRVISSPRGWGCSCECPAKMTMSGDSCGTEALLSKLTCVICFISGPAGTQRYGLKIATDSARLFGDWE